MSARPEPELTSRRIAFTCRYAPLPMIHAAGLVPFRILPLTDASDAAGTILHEAICPHVKRIVDRLVAGDLPELTGAVMVASCDAMRRLHDAWLQLRPDDAPVMVDLPFTAEEGSIAYLAAELRMLQERLEAWAGCGPITPEAIVASAEMYRQLASELDRLRQAAADGRLEGGWGRLQALRNRSVTERPEAVLAELRSIEPAASAGNGAGAPVFLLGNVLPEPGALDLFAACGVRLVEDDLCTGSRQLLAAKLEPRPDVHEQLARAMLTAPPCARIIDPGDPYRLASELARRAKASGARGVIAHLQKFCDPYLARMPSVRRRLDDVGLPLLVLEGDCTQRSLGQHRTRIEAFIEMIGTGSNGGAA